jgi:hypothetical protein
MEKTYKLFLISKRLSIIPFYRKMRRRSIFYRPVSGFLSKKIKKEQIRQIKKMGQNLKFCLIFYKRFQGVLGVSWRT